MRSLPFPAARRPLAAAIALLVALLATASRTSAQDVERATRIYDCVFLVTPKPDLPGPDLVRFPVGLTEEELLEADTGGFGTSLDPDRLVDLIQGNIQPDSWGHEKNTLRFAQGTLRVTQTPEVLDEIATFLDELRRKQQHTIHLVGRVLSVRLDHFAAAHARAARAGTPGAILSPEDVKHLLDVPRDDGRLAVLGTFSLPASSGQLVHAGSVRATRCILDLDVEIAEDATISHPFLDDVLTGIVLQLRPSLVDDGLVLLETRVARATLHGETKTLETGVGQIDLPVRALQSAATTLLLPEDHAALLAVTDAVDEGRLIVFLVEPRVVGPETSAAAEKESPARQNAPTREIRVYDTRFLVRHIADHPCPHVHKDFPGSAIDLEPRGEEEGGAVFGAPAESMPFGLGIEPHDLIELIRTTIAEDSWSNTRNAIDFANGLLMVVQTPEVHARIASFLAELRSRRGVLITTEVWALAVANDRVATLLPPPAQLGEPLAAEALRRVHEAIADGSAPVLRHATLTGFNRQRSHVLSVIERPVIAGAEAEVAKKASTVDPHVRPLRTGFVLDVQPTLVGDAKHIGLDLVALFVAAGEPRTVAYRRDQPYVVHEYHTEAANLLASVFLPDGGAMAFLRGQVPGRPDHQLVYLVTARFTHVTARE